MDGWMDGHFEADLIRRVERAGLRIAFSNQNSKFSKIVKKIENYVTSSINVHFPKHKLSAPENPQTELFFFVFFVGLVRLRDTNSWVNPILVFPNLVLLSIHTPEQRA